MSAIARIQSDGYCILNDVIPADRIEDIRSRVLDVVERVAGEYPGAPERIGFVPGVINHEQSFAEYLADERLLGIAGGLLGDHVRISFTSAIVNFPRNVRGHWHADWPFNQHNALHVPAPYPDAVFHLTTLWMISPFTEDNGGTLVVPGSHRRPTNPTAGREQGEAVEEPGERQVVGEAGSVLVFDSRLWHATAPNNSDQPRAALAVRYAPAWLNLDVLRPGSDERRRLVDESGGSDNQVPAIPRAVFDRLPDVVKPLYRHWVEQ